MASGTTKLVEESFEGVRGSTGPGVRRYRGPGRAHECGRTGYVNGLPPSGAGAAGGGEPRRVLERFDVGVVVRRMEAGFGRLPAYTQFEWPVDRENEIT